MKRLISLCAITIAIVLMAVGGCSESSSPAMRIGVSPDGSMVISSHRDNRVILWDVGEQSSRVLAQDASIYSAGFSNENYYWQDLSGRVQFSHGPVVTLKETMYSHALSEDAHSFVLSDEDWNIYLFEDDQLVSLKEDGGGPGFLGVGKPLNVAMDPDGSRLISSGRGIAEIDEVSIDGNPPVDPDRRRSLYAGLVLWDLEDMTPTAKMVGHSAKTYATFSPDGNYVVSVDENSKGFVWDAHDGSRLSRLARPGGGVWIGDGHPDPYEAPEEEVYDREGIHLESEDDLPEDFSNFGYVAVQFITDEHYLAFFYDQRYAALHQLGDPFALKMVDLGTKPFPSTGAYSRNASIASAPESGILVTGQQNGNGINVYQFDEETQELEKIWAPRRRSWWPF